MYIQYGRRVLRTDWLAIRTINLLMPHFVFLLFLIIGVFIFVSDLGSSGDSPYVDPPLSTVGSINDIDLIIIIPLLLIGSYFIATGQILVFVAKRDVVIRAVETILGQNGLDYGLDGDRFTVPSVNMRVEVTWSENSDLVGINRRTWERIPPYWDSGYSSWCSGSSWVG